MFMSIRSALFSITTLLSAATFPVTTHAAMQITFPSNAPGDARLAYPLKLLQLALDKAGVEYDLIAKPRPDSNKRVALLMKDEGAYDVAFFGTRPELEETLRPIRFPIHRGLLGNRVAITHRDNLDRFDTFDSLEDFQSLSICQGLGWSDTEILESVGLTVVKGNYANLFQMANANRCDVYTRAVFEAYHEVDDRIGSLPNLTVDDSILIRYRLASFIFVNPEREELAKAIEEGLDIAMQDGSFRALFEAEPIHRMAKENLGQSARNCIEIENPLLTEETAAIPAKYWNGFDFEEEAAVRDCTLVGTLSSN